MIPFQRFLDEHRDVVWRYAVASVGRQDADDVFQETFLSAMRAYPRLRPGSNLKAWVLTIAANKATDHHRARRRRAVPSADVPEVAVHDGELPEEGIWRSVRALPAKQRTAVALRFAADLDFAAIGAAMGTTPEAARRSVHEGLKKLRQEMTR
ncbi:MAG TPA: sigma-70 family RNA polymerase sigma factor [Solirubrobacteraceae bacterium]|nr:sigma-70 family RNA polymerase sigma factor [Solirubrobacteraceae bacterium]